jgi:hypothetical protein
MTVLISIYFKTGHVRYMEDFSVEIGGKIFPRHLAAASEMIQIFKRCSKDDSKNDSVTEIQIGQI